MSTLAIFPIRLENEVGERLVTRLLPAWATAFNIQMAAIRNYIRLGCLSPSLLRSIPTLQNYCEVAEYLVRGFPSQCMVTAWRS